MDIKTIKRFTRQLTYAYFLIALNVVSAIIFAIFSACLLHPKVRLMHACFHCCVDFLNIAMLVYLQPWRIVGALKKGLEYKRGFEAVKGVKDAN